ncbi:hypothetical protein ABTQ05_19915, partial [Acinetobacter baumannii]
MAPQVVAGIKGQMKLKASYFFGGPVANARVKYNVYSSPDYGAKYAIMPRPKYFAYFDDWNDEDDQSYSHYA